MLETRPRPDRRVAAPAGQPPLIAARAVSLSLGGRRILDHVSLALHRGEIVTVIGPNGAGKSTLARVLLGLLRPDRGTVEREAGLRIGYVPQRFQVPETVPIDVRRLLILTRRADERAVDAVLGETGIAHLKHHAITALSGGELQRALIARALLNDPGFLVLDEPVQGVDFIGEARLYSLIAAIRRDRQCGILMVSHDLHVVMAESDRVICLNGHVCCEGVPEAVKADPEFAKLFGLEASRVVAVYSHDHDHVHDNGGRAAHRHEP